MRKTLNTGKPFWGVFVVGEVSLDELDVVAARLAGGHPMMDEVAEMVAERVRGEAELIRDTGHLAASIQIASVWGPEGVRDRWVFSDDPGAAAIEYGYRDKATGRLHAGRRVFRTGAAKVKAISTSKNRHRHRRRGGGGL